MRKLMDCQRNPYDKVYAYCQRYLSRCQRRKQHCLPNIQALTWGGLTQRALWHLRRSGKQAFMFARRIMDAEYWIDPRLHSDLAAWPPIPYIPSMVKTERNDQTDLMLVESLATSLRRVANPMLVRI